MSRYTKEEILSKVDHTLLKPEATWPQVQKLCDEAIRYRTASVCINTCYVRQAVEYIAAVKAAVGDKVLKVIIETCLLTDEEKEKMCDIVVEAGADFIKTSTGFSTAGATFHDIELFARCVRGRCKIKAAGGISTVEDMEKFLDLGADRLGTSRAVGLLAAE